MNELLFMNEGVVDVPPNFRDLSVQVLEWRRDDGSAIGLTVQREELPEGTDLETYVRKAISEYYRELPSFRIDARRPVEGALTPAVFLSYRWHGEQGVVCQAQGFTQIGRKLLLFTTTTAPESRSEAEGLLLQALSNVRLRGSVPPPRAAG
ncbi:MAG: DcrB-related protein [Polyangiaceae bacterium]|nr:DcrB-related protein [Polyangiaceae bacterium]